MTYGILSSNSCLLTDIVDQLHENTKKVNSVKRLTRHLNKVISKTALNSYLQAVKKWVPSNPVIHIDDSDVIKPCGKHFEALDLVRDGSKSSDKKNVYETGYHVTEACVLTGSNHPVSIFQKFIPQKKKRLLPSMTLRSLPWNGPRHFLAEQPSSWTEVMMITRCF